MRLFGSEKLMQVFEKLGVKNGEQIEHKMLSNAIEKAQKELRETTLLSVRTFWSMTRS